MELDYRKLSLDADVRCLTSAVIILKEDAQACNHTPHFNKLFVHLVKIPTCYAGRICQSQRLSTTVKIF